MRLEVTGGRLHHRAAGAEEADAFWALRKPPAPLAPRIWTPACAAPSICAPRPGRSAVVGAKAAQLAELLQIAASAVPTACPGCPLPDQAVRDSGGALACEHFQSQRRRELAEAVDAGRAFIADPAVARRALAEVRAAIMAAPVDPELLRPCAAEIAAASATDGAPSISSNTEDLPGFNGAGLYASVSATDGETPSDRETRIATVWASLWTPRAYDERELGHIDHGAAAMGVLVHAAFLDERANGVAISRNVLDPSTPTSTTSTRKRARPA